MWVRRGHEREGFQPRTCSHSTSMSSLSVIADGCALSSESAARQSSGELEKRYLMIFLILNHG